jgi:Ser/Thr protein kinase RdoA (MazF antagonist)
MSDNWLNAVPEQLQATARDAISSAFGSEPIVSINAVLGGASGALAYRVAVQDRFYLLRMETRRGPLRNPHQYECMRMAAEAGIAPPLRYADDPAGVAIMDFIAARPLNGYPGGPVGLAMALGRFAARLQATAPFPILGDYRDFLDRMLGYLQTISAPGLLDQHREVFQRIRHAYPWDASKHVSSHNDPNPRNIVFDGDRLWLIDWETAYRNDPLTDIAILAENHAPTPELEEVLLRSWLGRSPDRAIHAQLRLMRQMTRLYYACLLLALSATLAAPITDLAAPTPDEFRAQIARGELKPASPETRIILGKMFLASVLADTRAPGFEEALTIAKNG